MPVPPPLPQVEFDSDSLKLRLSMEIPADPKCITEVVEGVMKVVGAMECACGHEDEIALALQEAVANAVMHGAKQDPTKTVVCRVACEDQHGMLIIVSDPGEGFDLNNMPNPHRAENLYSDHGRGIYLINNLMDQVEFRRNGAEIRMRKFLKPPDEPKP